MLARWCFEATRPRPRGRAGRSGGRRPTRGRSTSRPPSSSCSRARRPKPTSMIGSLRPWATKAAVSRRSSKLGRQSSTTGTKPLKARIPATAGRSRRQPHRVAHHRAHREAAEHGAGGLDAGLGPEPVVQLGERLAGGVEGVVVGIADARDQVPVVAGRARQPKRRPRRDHLQPPIGVERVGEAEQVALVGPAAVMEDEQPLRVPGGRPLSRSGVRGADLGSH